jgi:hypothetical protein
MGGRRRKAAMPEMKCLASSIRVSIALWALALAPGLARGLGGGEGLAGTPHDFTPSGTGDLKVTNAGAIGICTFCHTPHKAYSTQLLWNHTLSANSFSWDVPATTAGTTLPTLAPTYKGASVKCLSCHDGSVAVGDVGWFKEAPNNGSAALLNSSITASLGTGGEFLIANGSGPGNMAGNHPVGIPYPYGQVANTYNGITSGAMLVGPDWQANPLTFTNSHIRLFSDDGAGNISAVPATWTAKTVGIECSSCHDPHNKQSVDDLFLRGKMVGATQGDGYICEQCHIK